jgi:predicted Zn-dependent protease
VKRSIANQIGVNSLNFKRVNHGFFLWFLLVIGFAQFSCRKDVPEASPDRFVDNLYGHTNKLELIIAYEQGADPYLNFGGFDNWRITDYNLNQLLATQNIPVKVPHVLDSMKNLGVLAQNNYTRQNIIDIAADVQRYSNKDSVKGIVLLFLNGYLIKDGVIETRVLGLTIDGSAVVAIFKPVISASSSKEAEKNMVEQSTITHEIGHVLGLVNNGVPPTSPHHDQANGSHCSNASCVMYWKNGAGEVVQYIDQFTTGQDITLFGEQCMADLKAK